MNAASKAALDSAIKTGVTKAAPSQNNFPASYKFGKSLRNKWRKKV